MESGTLHSDELRRPRDVAAEARDLGHQVFALEDLARVAQREPHQLLASGAVRRGGHAGADLGRQHVGGDLGVGVAARQDHETLDVVAQLAHVARPVVRLEHRDRIAGDPALGQPRRGADLLHEERDQLGHVLAPLRQAGHADRHDAEAVEQVLAESPGRDLGAEIAARRGHDAHVHVDARRAPDALEVLVDEDPQDAVLRLPGHVRDLVDVKRPAVRLLERADPTPVTVHVLDAEQLGFHGVGRDRRRVDDDERAGGAPDEAWMVRAVSSLPEPGAPVIRMRALVGAARSIV